MLRPVALAALVATAAPAFGQTAFENVPKLEIAHRVSELVAPDIARISTSMRATGPSTDKVARDLAATVQRVLGAVSSSGVPTDATQSDGPVIEEVYEVVRDEQGREVVEKRRRTGYAGRYSLVITVAADDNVASLVPKLAQAGAIIHDVTYEASNAPARQQVLEERAVAGAIERVQRLLTAAGAKPGRLLSLTGPSSSENAADLPRRSARPPSSDLVIPVRPGRLLLSGSAQVIVEILPAQP